MPPVKFSIYNSLYFSLYLSAYFPQVKVWPSTSSPPVSSYNTEEERVKLVDYLQVRATVLTVPYVLAVLRANHTPTYTVDYFNYYSHHLSLYLYLS